MNAGMGCGTYWRCDGGRRAGAAIGNLLTLRRDSGRRRSGGSDVPSDLGIESALRRLIREIEVADYTDDLGHNMKMNTALLKAQTILDVHDVLSSGPVDLGDGSVEAALRTLVAECAMGDYRNRARARLVTSPAYLEAAKLVA
jgi:hypothetical protein